MTPARATEGQGQDGEDGRISPSEAATTGIGATKRQRLIDTEHRLVDEGRHVLQAEAQGLAEVERHLADRFRTSTPAKCWSRLSALDFMNSSMQFSALALLCLFPFLIIIAAEGGGDVRPSLIRRLGLNRAAAQDVDALMSTGSHAAATLNVIGGALVALGAIGVASTLQAWYQKVYAQPARTRWTRQVAAQLIWLVGLVAYLALQDLLYRAVAPTGTRAAVYAGFFALAAAFYWWTQHVLLMGKIRWSQLLPGGIGTGVCVTGLTVFSTYVFSGQIVSSYTDYGSIGVVMVLLSYLIGFGVCLHIGAVAGQMWNERHIPVPLPNEALPPEVTGQLAPD
jgi:membrane protein